MKGWNQFLYNIQADKLVNISKQKDFTFKNMFLQEFPWIYFSSVTTSEEASFVAILASSKITESSNKLTSESQQNTHHNIIPSYDIYSEINTPHVLVACHEYTPWQRQSYDVYLYFSNNLFMWGCVLVVYSRTEWRGHYAWVCSIMWYGAGTHISLPLLEVFTFSL